MGLLDEAIREHLELKRRRGADPSAVARAEHEALARVLPDASASVSADLTNGVPESAGFAPADPVPTDAVYVEQHADEADRHASFSAVDQVTAELDMQAVMEADADVDAGVAPAGAIEDRDRAMPAAGPGLAPAEDPEWELPGERDREPAPADIPGQERLSFE
jgi:hypothetical protein